MKRNLVIIILLIILSISCKTKDVEAKTETQNIIKVETYSFNADSLLHHIKTLSSDVFEGRRTGTKGGLKAKDYIIEQFKKLSIAPINTGYEQHFEFKSSARSYQGTNVLGLIKGISNNRKYIVLSAHYDHEGIKNNKIYNGADDDASGISALFAFAEYFKANPPKHNVILAAFDAEELGLKGAYHFMKDNTIQQKNIVLNLNMDMISRSNKDELYAVGTRDYPQLKPVIEHFKKQGKVNLVIGHDGEDFKDDWRLSSDHAAFNNAKIPYIYFGVEDHKDYHQPTDDYENIHPEFYKDAVETIIKVFTKFDAQEL